MAKAPTLDDLRRYAVARTPVHADHARRARSTKLGFVQADPIRAPARAQDLTLRHRVAGYRAGDLERRYPRLDDRGRLLRQLRLRAARAARADAPAHAAQRVDDRDDGARRAEAVLDFVRERGAVHPREVDAHFAHGTAHQLLGRLVERDDAPAGRHALPRPAARRAARQRHRASTRRASIASATPSRDARARDSTRCVDVIVRKYAPLPAASLGCRRAAAALRRAAVARRAARRAGAREGALAHAHVDGVDWYWPAGENPRSARHARDDRVRLLAPFDPVVWDRRRFELFWGWAYRFEAYTPAPKRKLGYYALPLLWRDQVIGWANAAVRGAAWSSRPASRTAAETSDAFRRELDAERRADATLPRSLTSLPDGPDRRRADTVGCHRLRRRRAASAATASSAAPASTSAEHARARASGRRRRRRSSRPALGPTICPAGEHDREGADARRPTRPARRLWRTSAVVDATSDRNTAPNSSARGEHRQRLRAQHRQQGRDREQRVQQRQRLAAAKALQQPGPEPRRGHHADAEQAVEGDDDAAGSSRCSRSSVTTKVM